MDPLIQEFLSESFEALDRLDRCLTELERRPFDAGLVGEIFRAIHTMKGSTGFLGYQRLERLAHSGEHVLVALRSGRLEVKGDVVTGLLRLIDRMRATVRAIAETGAEGVVDDAGDEFLLQGLERLCGEPAPGIAGPTGLRDAELASTATAVAAIAEKTLRVEVDLLNRMMNLMGELVLTRNEILQKGVAAGGGSVLAQRLDSVTGELRLSVMEARMQPLAQVFSKFPRMVRDLALSCGKDVRLELAGQETGLDKGLLEAVRDPLAHALRNAIDHGIETRAERLRVGKPAQGVVRMKALQSNGSVVIEMQDDGAGVSRSRVLAKAVERGLVSRAQAEHVTQRELLQMLFVPGLSTARTVTVTSGRGVGMDVVKSNVERVGGSIEIESEEGKGTLLRMRVPLTLATIPAFVVGSGGQRFCLPESALREVLCVAWEAPARGRTAPGATSSAAAPMPEGVQVRGITLPLIWLDQLLDLEPASRVRPEFGFFVAVLEVRGELFGVALSDGPFPEEIVVKPLGAGLREIRMFSGVTVLGSGEMAMILDVEELRACAVRSGGKLVSAIEFLGAAAPKVETSPPGVEFEQVLDPAFDFGMVHGNLRQVA